MAINSCKITLKRGETELDLTKLVDIKDFPDLGGQPEMLETTTLSDCAQTFVAGIQTMDTLQFTANYTLEEYKKVKETEDEEGYYQLEIKEDGAEGAFRWKGSHYVYVAGTGVNEVVNMIITIAPSTKIELVENA